MIFVDVLHAKANRVVAEYSSIMRRMDCCAALVIESASSSTTILYGGHGYFEPLGFELTVREANVLILSRTTPMPRSSDAFSSNMRSLYN